MSWLKPPEGQGHGRGKSCLRGEVYPPWSGVKGFLIHD
jgi:hypothetical protein